MGMIFDGPPPSGVEEGLFEALFASVVEKGALQEDLDFFQVLQYIFHELCKLYILLVQYINPYGRYHFVYATAIHGIYWNFELSPLIGYHISRSVSKRFIQDDFIV